MPYQDIPIVKKALDFAELSLAGKKRKSGEDVLLHCQRVVEILINYKISDSNTLAAAILHQSITDGAATIEDLRKQFGEDISEMVVSFESLKIIRARADAPEELAENLRKMFMTLSKDLRVVLIKLADILDNLTTLDFLDPDKRYQVAKETLEIFAPLAERLGMSEMRGQMQDLAFPYVYPAEYMWVKNLSKKRLDDLEKVMLHVKGKLLIGLNNSGIKPEIKSRVKHLYSLFTKLTRSEIGQDLLKIYDLVALRILVDDVKDCYEVLDTVHSIFKPFPAPISDYIAHPKPNGYQSLHTRVYGPSDLVFEIQIRTHQMNQQAEYGLAAHWLYSDKKLKIGISNNEISQGLAKGAQKLDWVKALAQWQTEIQNNNREYLRDIKTDFFGERIFCFTPKGDVKDLPKGSTPIDFGFKVHTNLGNRIIGAKVNDKSVSLDYKLKNGDVVELQVSKDLTRKPNRDWLNFVVTSLARKKIKHYFY